MKRACRCLLLGKLCMRTAKCLTPDPQLAVPCGASWTENRTPFFALFRASRAETAPVSNHTGASFSFIFQPNASNPPAATADCALFHQISAAKSPANPHFLWFSSTVFLKRFNQLCFHYLSKETPNGFPVMCAHGTLVRFG